LLPVVAFIFAAGVDYIILYRKELIAVLILFGIMVSYNYIDIWRGLSFGATHLQKARAFIEKTIPEFTNICITSNNFMPQLNMTKESYYHLIKTAPLGNVQRRRGIYSDMEKDKDYDNIFKELRMESLAKKPQYNLIRWDKDIKTIEEANSFLRQNNIRYILSRGAYGIAGKRLEETGVAFLVKEFKPDNERVYKAVVGGGVDLYLYEVNKERMF
jgi:hypothetical protein